MLNLLCCLNHVSCPSCHMWRKLFPAVSKNYCHSLWQCINIDSFGVIICYNVVTGKMKQQFYSLFSQNENWAKLSVQFELHSTSWQPMNQFGWNVANLLPDTMVVILKTTGTNFDFFFSFLRCIFSTGNANDLLFLTSFAYNKRKNETFPTFPRALHTSYPATLFPFLVPNIITSPKEDLIYLNLF